MNCLPYDLQQQLQQIGDLTDSHLVCYATFPLPYQNCNIRISLQEPFKFNQSNFDCAVAKWIAACDQPFEATEKFEFKEMMHAANPRVSLPSSKAVKHWVMGMADDTFSELRTMIAVSDLVPQKPSNLTC